MPTNISLERRAIQAEHGPRGPDLVEHCRWRTSQTMASAASSTQSTPQANDNDEVWNIATTVDCYVLFGGTGLTVTSANGKLINAGSVRSFKARSGDYVYVIDA